MLRFLFALVLVAVVGVLVLAYFGAVSWPGMDRGRMTAPSRPGGTSGDRPLDSGAIRERATELGEKSAAAADRAAEILTDGALTAKIKSKMALDDLVRARDIDVAVADGVARLRGVVSSQPERERAVQLARETAGIRSVTDELQVGSPP